ncbi:hypothetical protein BRC68_15710 [Halobacteriales archaeon QH_6_64_20]|nr:MAG: hypothetical protein BRC68_15710 [Halobacteriales archaeon QH_6_64_20]
MSEVPVSRRSTIVRYRLGRVRYTGRCVLALLEHPLPTSHCRNGDLGLLRPDTADALSTVRDRPGPSDTFRYRFVGRFAVR